LSLSPNERGELCNLILSMFEAEDFDSTIALATVFELSGEHHPILLAIHAVSCAELGQSDQARAYLHMAEAASSELAVPGLDTFMHRARSFLLGGKQHRAERERLKAAATRYQPRSASKPQRTRRQRW
jgi:hypothetical protein